MASCSFPPSFIMLSLCTLPSLPGRELLFLSMQPATSSSCQGNKLCALLREPCKTPPTASPLSITVTLLHRETQYDSDYSVHVRH